MTESAYTTLGDSYDKLISGYPYQKVTEKIISEISGKGFDVGSGSGLITVELAKSGISVIGVEKSAEMLEKAVERAKRDKVNPVFVKESAEKIEFTPCNFVIATCDVLNYLKSKTEFEKFIKKAYAKLKPDGKLIFDIRRATALQKMNGQVFYEDRESITYLWLNKLKGDKLIMDITFFKKEQDSYKRSDERHEFLVLEDDYVIELLKSVGFTVKTYGDGLGKRKDSDNRLFIFCNKK